MRAIVALGLAGLVIAGCGSSKTVTKTVGAPPTAPVSTPTATTTPDQQPVDNSCDALGINRAQRKEGTCIDRSGVKVTVVDKTSTLKLKTLTARFVGSRMASSLGDPGFTKTASGTYVVITVAVTNRLDTPVSFAGIGGQQTFLILPNDKNYSEDFDAENGADNNSFVTVDKPIQPGETRTGDVVFDVPNRYLKLFGTPGTNLAIADFGHTVDEQLTRFGEIRLYD